MYVYIYVLLYIHYIISRETPEVLTQIMTSNNTLTHIYRPEPFLSLRHLTIYEDL